MGLPIPKLSDKTFNEIFTDARALISRVQLNLDRSELPRPGDYHHRPFCLARRDADLLSRPGHG